MLTADRYYAEITASTSYLGALVDGADLVLVNRVVDYGFESPEGVEIVRTFSKAFPAVKMMLVSNHESAQTAAVEAGALPGFGKREIGSPKVKALLQKALGTGSAAAASTDPKIIPV